MKVLICPNADRDLDLEITKKVNDIFISHGVDTVVCPLFDTKKRYLRGAFKYAEIESAVDGADLAVCLGGDGTILRTARAVAEKEVPIIGINMGSVGFMAELEPEDVDLIEKVITGEYSTDKRVMLDVEVLRDGMVVLSDFALNDIVIKGESKAISLEIYGDHNPITSFSGDGAVISTPTGSTAYSMAAGGPIVEPDARNIIITPICAHVLAARSFVLAPDREVRVMMSGKKANPSGLSVDGRDLFPLEKNDVITIRVSETETKFIRLTSTSFYKKVYKKLGERQ